MNMTLASPTDESVQIEREEVTILLLWSLVSLYFRYSPSNGLDVAVGQSSSNYLSGHRRVELWSVGLRGGHINGEVGRGLRGTGERSGD